MSFFCQLARIFCNGILSVMKTMAAPKVSVPKGEYVRLKKIDRQFGTFLSYARHLMDIGNARQEARAGRLISQESLFRRLGL